MKYLKNFNNWRIFKKLLLLSSFTLLLGSGPGLSFPRLHKAIDKGDYKKVIKLVKNGHDINDNYYTFFEYAPLHIASSTQRFETKEYEKIVEFLVNQPGININIRDYYNSTPLHYASKYGHSKIVEILLARGADVNARNDYSVNPLIYALGNKHFETVKVFLNYVDIDKTYFGRTLLLIASRNKDFRAVEFLISQKADVNVRDLLGQTALDYAIENKDLEMIKLLIANGASNKDDIPVRFTGYTKTRDIKGLMNVKQLCLESFTKDIYKF